MIDYALWDAIKNGATLPKTKFMGGVIIEMPITTAKEKAQKRLEVKARSTLMMGIPNEHQLKFNSIKDAKKLMKAVEKRFGENVATRKTQRNLLKQQYENSTAPSSEMKLIVNGNETIGFDKSKMKCYNCHKRRHFVMECKAPRNQDNKNKESSRRSVPVETSTFTTFVSCDGIGGHDWSDQVDEGPNYALMTFSSLSSDSELIECHIVDNCKKSLGYENYNAVPPPYTGNFMPPTPDLSFTSLDKFVNEPLVENCKVMSSEEEPKVVRKYDDAARIKEWVSDGEEDDVSQPKIEKKTVRPSIVKIEFVKSKQQEKTARKTVKQVEQHRQNTHSPRGNQRN
nr:hypothetical protein [Tanacetum cinerariifolium]